MELELDQAARRVCGAYQRLLATVVRSILGDAGTAEDVEDCVQEVLWEYLRQQDRLDGDRGSEKTYLCVLARSRARTLRKKLLSRRIEPLPEEAALEAPDEVEGAAVRLALKEALGALTAEERRLFTLRFLYQWPTTETARALGISRTAVTTRTGRMREKLGRLLEEQGITWSGKEREP